uniref:Hydroxyacyl-thioester dehydratase type 2, mitochondrial n=1 Tax=Lygus hesperus TaxID=30085 RepID=A0A146MDW1_LYGHE
MKSLQFLFREPSKNFNRFGHQLYACCRLFAYHHSSSGHKTLREKRNLDLIDVAKIKGDPDFVYSKKLLSCSRCGFLPGASLKNKTYFLSPTIICNYLGTAKSLSYCLIGSTTYQLGSTTINLSWSKFEVEKSFVSEHRRETSTDNSFRNVAAQHPGRLGLRLLGMQLGCPVRRFSSWAHNLSSRRYLSTEGQTEHSVVMERLVTREDVEAFARLSGDTNPVHFSGKALVHGALLNSFLSGVIGTKLPGPGTILVSQSFKFPNPCYIGDVIVIQVSVSDVRKISVCQYLVSRKSDNQSLMEGEAKVIVRKDFISESH